MTRRDALAAAAYALIGLGFVLDLAMIVVALGMRRWPM